MDRTPSGSIGARSKSSRVVDDLAARPRVACLAKDAKVLGRVVLRDADALRDLADIECIGVVPKNGTDTSTRTKVARLHLLLAWSCVPCLTAQPVVYACCSYWCA